MKKDNIFKILSIIVITFILLLFYSKIHQCDWDYCPHKGKLMISSNFISYWGYEELRQRSTASLGARFTAREAVFLT